MKERILLTILMTLLLTESLLCQFNLNVSSGVNISNIKASDNLSNDSQSRLGYFLEFAPSYRINDRVQLLLNLQYSQKGYKSVEVPSVVSQRRIIYFDIIPELEYQVIDFLSLGLGINYGFRLDEQFKIDDGDWQDPTFARIIESDDFGLVGKVKFSLKQLYVFARYNLGLKSIATFTVTDLNGDHAGEGNWKNRNLQIGVGYAFGVNRK